MCCLLSLAEAKEWLSVLALTEESPRGMHSGLLGWLCWSCLLWWSKLPFTLAPFTVLLREVHTPSYIYQSIADSYSLTPMMIWLLNKRHASVFALCLVLFSRAICN